MARYSVQGNRATLVAAQPALVVQCTATARRLKIYEAIFGSEATPADVAILWEIGRLTVAPTAGTAVTPAPLDPADAASLFDATEGAITAPAIGTQVLGVPLNQRATFRWVAAPGAELVGPATDNNGFGVYSTTINGAAPSGTVQIYVDEQ